MLFYNLRIALKSIRRNPLLSVLIVSGIALGIGVSTTFLTMHHVVSKDPIPAKSKVLHYVRLDSWDPNASYPGEQPPTQVTYMDMRGIMESDIPVRQTGMFKTRLFVFPEEEVALPYRETIRLCTHDFFSMFDVPFRYGSAWDARADAESEQVVVIDEATNQKLFGGRDSVGETIRIENREFRVVGVLERWRPSIKFYDMTQNAFQEPEAIFMPFNLLLEMQLQSVGNSDGWANWPQDGFEGLLASEQCWLQMWVELPDEESKRAYEDFLVAYVMGQRETGRFQREIDNRVTNVTDLMAEWDVVPASTPAISVISVLFLVVCALNLMGLLLGKFLARAPEVGVRRALGASRLAVFLQHLVECELVGVLGGVLGLGLALVGLFIVNKASPFGDMFRLDAFMVMMAILLSLVAGLIAGAYPAWRICTIPPARHLKIQ